MVGDRVLVLALILVLLYRVRLEACSRPEVWWVPVHICVSTIESHDTIFYTLLSNKRMRCIDSLYQFQENEIKCV